MTSQIFQFQCARLNQAALFLFCLSFRFRRNQATIAESGIFGLNEVLNLAEDHHGHRGRHHQRET